MDKIKVETAASVIAEELPESIKKYYSSKISKNPAILNSIKKEMGSWWEEHSFSDTSNINYIIIYVIEQNSLMGTSSKQYFKSVAENRRNQKKYWFKTIQEEMGIDGKKPTKNNKMLLEKDCDSYFFLKNTKTEDLKSQYSTREEYKKARFRQIEKWKNGKSSLLIDYVYIDTLAPTSIAKAIIADIGYETLYYIDTKMYGFYGGYVTLLPDDIFEAPGFSFRQETLNLKTVDDGESISVLDEYSCGDATVQTVVKTYDISEFLDSESESLINQLKVDDSNGSKNINAKTLDTNDLMVFGHVYQQLTAANIAQDNIELSLDYLCRLYFNKSNIRNREYIHVLKKIEKLASYTLKYEKLKDGIYEKSIMRFFDVHYQMPTTSEANFSKTNIDDKMADILSSENLSEFDLSKTVIQFNISSFFKEGWRASHIKKVCTSIYNKIDAQDSKIKAILFLLEEERLRIYPNTLSENLPYSFFTSKLRFGNLKPNKIRKEIENVLESLKDQKIIIEDFAMQRTGVDINFYPFSHLEKEIYLPMDSVE